MTYSNCCQFLLKNIMRMNPHCLIYTVNLYTRQELSLCRGFMRLVFAYKLDFLPPEPLYSCGIPAHHSQHKATDQDWMVGLESFSLIRAIKHASCVYVCVIVCKCVLTWQADWKYHTSLLEITRGKSVQPWMSAFSLLMFDGFKNSVDFRQGKFYR